MARYRLLCFGTFMWVIAAALPFIAACTASVARPVRIPHGPAKDYHGRGGNCREFIESLPLDYSFGFITVPEDPHYPKGAQVDVFYYGRQSTLNPAGPFTPQTTPILFLNDGPGRDSHAAFELMSDRTLVVAAWADAPLIFMDQRGTGCSSPYPRGAGDAMAARLRLYGSSAIVSDAEQIRQKLFGSQPWKVYGQGYGAFVAHRYAAVAAKSLVTVAAHGGAIVADPRVRAADQVEAENRVLEQYFNQYPDDRARLESLHEFLTPTTCFPSATALPRRCGLAAIDHLVFDLAYAPRWPWLHEWLGAMVQDGRVVGSRLTDYLMKNVFSESYDPAHMSDWPAQAIDFLDANILPFDRATCESAYVDLHARGETPENFLLQECMVAMQFVEPPDQAQRNAQLEALAHTFGVDVLSADNVRLGLSQNPAAKFFIYSSALDPLMPAAAMQPELDALAPFITYRQLWASGHDGYYTDTQIPADVLN